MPPLNMAGCLILAQNVECEDSRLDHRSVLRARLFQHMFVTEGQKRSWPWHSGVVIPGRNYPDGVTDVKEDETPSERMCRRGWGSGIAAAWR